MTTPTPKTEDNIKKIISNYIDLYKQLKKESSNITHDNSTKRKHLFRFSSMRISVKISRKRNSGLLKKKLIPCWKK
jgi:uncharacterized membrane-anchored protein YhcB (DUF1043 family)